MSSIAIIGGSSLAQLEKTIIQKRKVVRTPYGEPSSPIVYGELGGVNILFLARHGHGVTIPPHLINYRANLWALADAGVNQVIAVGSVGSLVDNYPVGSICIPDQVIDYTHSRDATYFDSVAEPVNHVDFSEPFSANIRAALINAMGELGKNGTTCVSDGCYAAMQGPRFETKAEVMRLHRDGNHIVGMTAMPEAILARELGIEYGLLTIVTNDARTSVSDGRAMRREQGKALRDDMDGILLNTVSQLYKRA